jgi:hypothetical protein
MKKLNRVCNRNEKKWNVGHDLGKFNSDRKYDIFVRKIILFLFENTVVRELYATIHSVFLFENKYEKHNKTSLLSCT